MLINEAQYKVGLTKKSIRYYEAEGLLEPKRNSHNDYREYDASDLKTLKLIKFLRELNVPVTTIKRLKNKELSLKECMQERLKSLEEAEKEYHKIKEMCEEIYNENLEYDNIDITKYSEEMNVLNKRGVTLKDFKKTDQRKILGACLSSIIFCLFFLLLLILFTYLYFKEDDFPFIIYLFLCVVFGFPILGTIINLIKRIQEIKGGEENVASKY